LRARHLKARGGSLKTGELALHLFILLFQPLVPGLRHVILLLLNVLGDHFFHRLIFLPPLLVVLVVGFVVLGYPLVALEDQDPY